MAYRLPTFNLVVNYWIPGSPTTNPPDGTFLANMTPGKRVTTQYWDWGASGLPTVTEMVLCPLGVPVTSRLSGPGTSTLEVPAGSGWFYTVEQVLRIATGFANAHLLLIVTVSIPAPM